MRKETVKRRWVPGRQTLSPLPAWSDPRPRQGEERAELEEPTRASDVTYDPCYGRIELLREGRRTEGE